MVATQGCPITPLEQLGEIGIHADKETKVLHLSESCPRPRSSQPVDESWARPRLVLCPLFFLLCQGEEENSQSNLQGLECKDREVSSSVRCHLPSTWFSWLESSCACCMHPEGGKGEWFLPTPFMQQVTTELSLQCRAVVLKVGSPDQQHENHLGTG